MLPSASGFEFSAFYIERFFSFCIRILSEYGRTADDISDSMVIKCVSAPLLLHHEASLLTWPSLDLNGHSHISPFLFTRTLLPVMEKTALELGSDVRIVNVCTAHTGKGSAFTHQAQVSSVAHGWVPNPRYDSLEAFNNDFSSTYKPKTNVYGESFFLCWSVRVLSLRKKWGVWMDSVHKTCKRPLDERAAAPVRCGENTHRGNVCASGQRHVR
jgi:hypothetical protein